MQGKLGVAVFLLTCVIWQAQGAVNCTETGPGRFPDPVDTTCKAYSLCIYINTNNSFISYDYICPSTSFFDPTTRLCTTNYVCSPTNITTDTVCIADGFVANPNSTDCTSYIQCVQINGTFVQTVLNCPANTFYNPNTTLCEVDYNCTQTQVVATCTSVGRIPDTTDLTCQRYFLCVATTNGTLIEYSYTCPSTSVFSPTSRVCTTNYICPT